MLKRFQLHEPKSVKDVPPLLSKYCESAAILAGGTELLLVMKQGMVDYEHVINIKTISGLDKIIYDENKGLLRIGPLVKHRDLEMSDLIKEKWPVMSFLLMVLFLHRGMIGAPNVLYSLKRKGLIKVNSWEVDRLIRRFVCQCQVRSARN